MSDQRIELRELGNGRAQVDVLASRTGNWYQAPGNVLEMVQKGAFRRTLAADPNVNLLIGHAGLPLAATRPKDRPTLRLRETEDGLIGAADLDMSDPDVQAVVPKIRAGVCEASFAFSVMKGGQSWNDDFSRRTLTAINLEGGDLSICARGANPLTGATLRGAATLEQRRRVANRIGDRVLGPMFTGVDACVRCGGGDPCCPSCGSGPARSAMSLPNHARQRLELLRLSERGSTPPRGHRRVVRLPDYTDRARQELDVLRRKR